jgi:hypothetical protein
MRALILSLPKDVGEPDFQGGEADAFLQSYLAKARGEAFLKSSIAPSAWA